MGLFGGVNEEMTVFANRKVALAPVGDVVELGSVSGGPAISGFAHLGRDGDFCVQFNNSFGRDRRGRIGVPNSNLSTGMGHGISRAKLNSVRSGTLTDAAQLISRRL